MQYSRNLGRGRLLQAIVAGLIVCVGWASPADAAKRHHHRHARSHAVVTREDGGGSLASSPRYAAYVVDDKTGRVLYAKNADAPRHPASLTKMMTLYILFEELDRKRMSMSTPLKVSARSSSQAPSKLGLRPGQTIEVEDAIRALVTKSANDVAATIAENIGGTEEAFARRMTRTARRLGMNGTTFFNASGLPNNNQWTTARDMVILGRALAERYPGYYRYFSTRSFAWGNQVIGNHNKLLYRMEGIDGIKTGYTGASGFNLVSSLRRDNRHVVAAVMGGSSGRERDDHMISLLNAHVSSASTGGKVSSVFREVGRSADASDEDAPIGLAAAEMPAAVPVPTPAPAPQQIAQLTPPQPASSAPMPLAAPAPKPAAEPLAYAAEPAPSLPSPAPSRPNQPRIAASDVVPIGRADEPARASDQHGAAVAMARAILLPQSGRPAGVAAAPQPVKTVSIAVPVQTAPAVVHDETPPSLATATVTQSEVDRIVTGSTPRRDEAAPARVATAVVPAPTAPAAPAATLASSVRTGWLVQIGAYDQESKAREALADARAKGGRSLASAEGFTETVGGPGSGLWRARFGGFADQSAADGACRALKQKKFACLALRQ